MLLPFCPLQAGYAGSFEDGVARIGLAGGRGRYRVGMIGNSNAVNASWLLRGPDYSAFMAFYRQWSRTAEIFEIDMILESHEMLRYQASFIPGSIKLDEKNGPLFRVSAQLEVLPLPEFTDVDLDQWWNVLQVIMLYGGPAVAGRVPALLEKLVNEDLPHA